MRKLILFLLCAAAWAQQTVTVSPLIAIVQKHAAASSGSVASLANVFSSNVLAGNSIVVNFCNGNVNAPTAAITDTQTLTWTKAAHVVQGSAFECDQWYAVSATGGAETVTVTPGGSNASIASEIYELSGMVARIPAQADVTTTGSGSSGTASATAVAPMSPDAIMISGVGVGTAAQTITVNSACPACFTNDSGQQNPTTPAGLFSFVSMSVTLDDEQAIQPSATFTSEPWAVVAGIYHAQALPIAGTVRLTDGTNNVSATGTSLNVNVTNVNSNGQAVMASSAPVVIASNQSAIAAAGQGATASAVPSGATYAGANSSGNLTGIIACDNSATVNMVTATTTQIVAISGTSGRTYICSIDLVAAGADNVAIISGSGTNCASNQAGLAGGTTAATGWNLAANGGLTKGSGLGMIWKTATTNNEICLVTSAAVQLSGSITYTQF
jgi:hypothetical protein